MKSSPGCWSTTGLAISVRRRRHCRAGPVSPRMSSRCCSAGVVAVTEGAVTTPTAGVAVEDLDGGPVGGHVDAVAFLRRGARPSRNRSGEHDFLTPSLPTPVIARPTVWSASQQSVEEAMAGVEALESGASASEMRRRLRDAGVLLEWLRRFPGESWQQRWLASGVDTAGRAWPDLLTAGLADGTQVEGLPSGPATVRSLATGTAGRLILLDVIRPGYDWLYSSQSWTLFPRFEQVRDPEGFAAISARCAADLRMASTDRRAALVQLSRILMHNGGRLVDITLADCVEAYRAQSGYGTRCHSRWYGLLREVGIVAADAPPTIYAASRRGQLTIPEIVDAYNIECPAIRDLFVDYLTERAPGLDYTTIRQLASKLILLFWRDLELHEPGIDSLHLSDASARAWKLRLGEIRYGNHRLGKTREDPFVILTAVRAFYADLSHWALEDPARWAQWAAPSPVDSRRLASTGPAAATRRSSPAAAANSGRRGPSTNRPDMSRAIRRWCSRAVARRCAVGRASPVAATNPAKDVGPPSRASSNMEALSMTPTPLEYASSIR